MNIPPSFLSRISNKTVFERAGVVPMTQQLLHKQLALLGHVARSPPGDPLRRDTFVEDAMKPIVGHFIRKVGRPAQNWTEELLRHGAVCCGGNSSSFLENLAQSNQLEWKQFLQKALGKT